MKHKAKRIVSAICALALCAAMLPVQAFADTEVTGSSVVEPADSTTGDTTLDTTPDSTTDDTTGKQDGDTPAATTGGTTDEQSGSAPSSGTTPETTTGDSGEGTTPAAGSGNDEQGQTQANGSQDGASAKTDAPTMSPFTYDVAPLTAAPQASNTVTVTYNAGKLDGESLENVVENSDEKGQFDAKYIVNTTDPNGNKGNTNTSEGNFSVTFTVQTEGFPCSYTVMYPADRVVKKGETWYVFDGWKVEGAADEDGRTLTFDSGTGTTEVTLTASGNVTLTAQWKKNENPTEEPRFPGDPITIEVYLDGQLLTNVNFGDKENDYIDFSSSKDDSTSSEVKSTQVKGAEEPEYETRYEYTYNKANCADLKFTVNENYQLVAVDADIVWGAKGGEGIVSDGNGWLVDNIKNGSTVALYLATPYKVVYYVDGKLLGNEDANTYYADADVTANDKNSWYIKGNAVDEENQVINAWDGTQTPCDAIWENDLATSIQLKETTLTIDGKQTNVIGWYKSDTGTDLLRGTLALSDILAADSGYTIDSNNHIIKFFGTSEQAKITVTKEGEAKPDSVNGGMNIDYTITVTNTGNSALTKVELHDPMFDGLTNKNINVKAEDKDGNLVFNSGCFVKGKTASIKFTDPALPVGGTVTVTYTHAVTELPQPDGTLTVPNQVEVTATTENNGTTTGEDTANTEVYAGTVTLTPAPIVVYTGGTSGENQVVVGDQESDTSENSGLPTLGFTLTGAQLPDSEGNTDKELVQFIDISKGGFRANYGWVGTLYNANAKNLLTITPKGDNKDPVRIKVTDEEGNTVVSDDFEVTKGLYRSYTTKLYVGDENASANAVVVAKIGDSYYQVKYGESKLTVRGTATEAVKTNPVVKQDSNLTPSETPQAVVAPDATYTYVSKNDTNDGKLQVADTSSVSLLVDEIVDQNDTTQQQYVDLMKQKAEADADVLGAMSANKDRQWRFYYMDLVLAGNGNAVLTTDKDVTIVWPYPDGVTMESVTNGTYSVKALHYVGMARNYDDFEKELEGCGIAVYDVTATANGLQFTVPAADGFSPFALVWEKDKPTQPSGGSQDNNDNSGDNGNNNNNNINTSTSTSNQSTTVNVSASAAPASAPAAAAPAATAVPQTSDDMPLGALTATAVAAAAAFVALLVVRKRRQSRD